MPEEAVPAPSDPAAQLDADRELSQRTWIGAVRLSPLLVRMQEQCAVRCGAAQGHLALASGAWLANDAGPWRNQLAVRPATSSRW